MEKKTTFGEVLEALKKGYAARLPHWSPEVVIQAKFPDENSDMTAPYLYVESRYGKVPWKETMVELFAENWEILYPLTVTASWHRADRISVALASLGYSTHKGMTLEEIAKTLEAAAARI